MLTLFLFLLVPAVIQILFALAGIIPYVGDFFHYLSQFLSFFLYLGIGAFAAEEARGLSPGKKRLLLGYTLVVCAFAFTIPYVAGYYTYPVKVARVIAAEKHGEFTYAQASDAVKALLVKETGSDGVIAYAIYTERVQLSSASFGEYVGKQFSDIDDLGGLLSAVINTILHAIPMLLKSLLCNGLGLIREAGLIGLGFWYLFSVILAAIGYAYWE